MSALVSRPFGASVQLQRQSLHCASLRTPSCYRRSRFPAPCSAASGYAKGGSREDPNLPSHCIDPNLDLSWDQEAVAHAAAQAHAPPPPDPPAEPVKRTWLENWNLIASEQSRNLQHWGIAGVVSYGALNLVYYSTAFVLCWMYIVKVPSGQGLLASAQAFPKVLALAWAGSQATKLPRAAGALFMAPFADRLLVMAVEMCNLKSKQQAFLWFLFICITLAIIIFSAVIFAWR